MHFLFSLLRIKGLYMFRALLTYSQEGFANGTSACAAPPEGEQVMLEACRGSNS
jgi:hypothetical protein